jgi:glycosyltransferase involved in cell wall biosynthesis
MRRNEWFQKRAAAQLKRLHDEGRLMNHALFAYSYAARSLLELGRAWGLPTVLGQIDPGPVEEQIVGRLHKAESSGRNSWQPAPPEYWQSWKRECELADRILVNSDWSRQSLIEAGIDADKIMVAPLAFEPPAEAASFSRCYPDRFTAERPLQLLFLGQVIVRKGIRELIEAMKLLKSEPVVLQVVGPNPGEVIPRPAANIQWLGAASRSQAMRYYRGADIFMFPTHSDGFGLTQLEAQAWKLPIISSRFCGGVDTHGRNGLVLDSIDARNIERAVRTLLEQPEKLRAMSARSVNMEDYGLAALRSRLEAVVSDIKG